MSFEDKIYSLIDTKREGTNWDFKELPHENNASLLHDIISMANCNHNDDRYIILGVSDPKKGCKIVGLSKGQTNRKEQAEIIDLLRKKEFAGDIRPEIELKTIRLEDEEVDVIVVFNKPNKPYYLTKNFRCKGKLVSANYIYTRILDANTPIDKSADIYHIEKMWRERFGLDLTPLERMSILLKKPNEWFKDLGNKPYAYHKQFPEFRIEFSEAEEGREVFSFFYTSCDSFFGDAIFKYHSTTLFELQYFYVDEMRLTIGQPKAKPISLNGYRNWYYFFDLSSLDGLLHYFLTDGNIQRSARGDKCQFLFFNNKDEQKRFDNFLTENQDLFENMDADNIANYAKERMEKHYNSIAEHNPIFVNKARKMYERWRSEIEYSN